MKTLLATHCDSNGESPSLSIEQSYLVDRPFLLHVVEQLIVAGLRDVTFLVAEKEDWTERWLGDGSRWGCRFAYIETSRTTCVDAVRVWSRTFSDQDVLIGNAYTWLPLNKDLLQSREAGTFVDFHNPAAGSNWQGWSVVPCEWLQDASATDWPELGEQMKFLADCNQGTIELTKHLSGATYRSLLQAQQQILGGEVNEIVLYGRSKQPGVRLCRNVKIDRTASIRGPVLLGDDVWIGRGCVIEAGSVIGHGAVIDRNTRIARSCVMPRTLVDPDLNLVDCWVDGGGITNVRLGGRVASAEWGLTTTV